MKKLTALLVGLLVIVMALTGERVANTKPKQPTGVSIRIDISSQSMAVDVNGRSHRRWKLPTVRSGYYTPRGAWLHQATPAQCGESLCSCAEARPEVDASDNHQLIG